MRYFVVSMHMQHFVAFYLKHYIEAFGVYHLPFPETGNYEFGTFMFYIHVIILLVMYKDSSSN